MGKPANTETESPQQPKHESVAEGSLPPVLLWGLLLAFLAAGLFWRSNVFQPLPTGFHIPRYYAGMVRARTISLSMKTDSLSAQEQGWLAADIRPFGEPPLLEFLTALTYLADGQERPWVACLFSCAAWLAGGWFLYDLTRRLTRDQLGGLIALGFYLVCPLGIVISQTFQPEALMTLGFLFALWLIVRCPASTTWPRTVCLALVGGVATAVKPGIMYLPLVAAFAARRFVPQRPWEMLWDWKTIAFAIVSAIPGIAWVLLVMSDRVGGKLMPTLWTDPFFYAGWWRQVDQTISMWMIVPILCGALVLIRKYDSWLGAAMLASYVAYAFAFPWHTATHNYYQTVLIPTAAICLGALGSTIGSWLDARRASAGSAAVAVVSVAALSFLYAQQTSRLVDLNRRVDVAAAIGADEIAETVPPLTKVLCISPAGGYPLVYHCWLDAETWPIRGDLDKELLQNGSLPSVAQRMQEMLASHAAGYFVITRQSHVSLYRTMFDADDAATAEQQLAALDDSWQREKEIIAWLHDNCELVARDQRFLIFDLRGQTTGAAATADDRDLLAAGRVHDTLSRRAYTRRMWLGSHPFAFAAGAFSVAEVHSASRPAAAPPTLPASVWVVVPAYNESTRLAGTLDDLQRIDATVVVIDDGSSDDTADVALRHDVWLVQHPVNCGQGASLQTGIDFALSKGAEYIVTFDADGQHRAEDIPPLLAALAEHNAEVALGSRFLDTRSNVPRARRWLLKAAVLFTRVVSQVRVTDAHNGLRAFTRNAAEQIRLTQFGMAHASEILDQIRARDLTFVEVPVCIRYTQQTLDKGQSSWNALRIVGQLLLGRFVR